jgi:Carboxypeptidase regulatory-like domain
LRNSLLTLVFLLAGLALCFPGSPGVAAQKESKKEIHESQGLVYGTVFTDKGFLLPGADVRVRRTTDRKAKWKGISDRRGEFAIRVPGGAQYEITVKAKGFAPMTKTASAVAGVREDLLFRLELAPKGKKQ